MGSYENPDQWGTLNNTTAASGVFTAEKASPGNPGTSYLKLTSKTIGTNVVNGIAVSGVLDSITLQPVSGFAYTLRPASFSGKWQHMIFGSSQGSISTLLTRWDTGLNQRVPVASANQTLTGMAMNWQNFTINFNYLDGNYPDSCTIILKASGTSPTDHDYLWVDSLAFLGSVTGIENETSFLKSISVFPNPSTTILTIDLNLNSAQQVNLEITDLMGKVIFSKNAGILIGISTQLLDISNLAKGSYHINISTGNGNAVRKIFIQ